MAFIDLPLEARFARVEERLGAIERDLAVVREALKRIPSPWLLLTLILPLYAIIIFGFAAMFYFLLNYTRPGG